MYTGQTGALWVGDPSVAALAAQALRSRDGWVYELDDLGALPNHAQLVCVPLGTGDGSYHSPVSFMHSLRRLTARQGNLELGRKGSSGSTRATNM